VPCSSGEEKIYQKMRLNLMNKDVWYIAASGGGKQMIWRIKSCPHCGGDTFLNKDISNIWVENCLQCGYEAVLKTADNKLQKVRPVEKVDVRQAIRS
jgi:predicted  nucleic acid-binding Zn ribbon protein